MIDYSTPMVDAIEEGRIVRVSAEYAKREGLLILRKTVEEVKQVVPGKKEDNTRKNKGFIGMEDLRKPLSIKNNELMKELIENFHWTLVQKRKARSMTRKKLADTIGETEVNVKMIENGVLPANNFILVNKLENFYGISLRKNKLTGLPSAPLRQIIDFKRNEAKRAEQKVEGIEIIDDEVFSKKDNKKVESKEDVDFIELDKL